MSQLPDPQIAVLQHPEGRSWTQDPPQQQGRELQDRLQDRFRSVFFKSLLAGLVFLMHIQMFVWCPAPGLDWVSHWHCPAGHRDSVPGSAPVPGHEGTRGKGLLGHPRAKLTHPSCPQHRRWPSLLCPLHRGDLSCLSPAGRGCRMWLPGHTPARPGGMGLRHSRGMQCCPAGALGSARPYLGPTLLWGQPEGWQLLSTLPGCWWHPGGQGMCGCRQDEGSGCWSSSGFGVGVCLSQASLQGCSIFPQPPACPWDIS